MGGMCLCRTCLFSAYLGGSSRQDTLGPCERQTSSLPWPSEPWTMPILELHCIIDGDIVMAGSRYGAVAMAARVALPLFLASGFPRSMIDCGVTPGWQSELRGPWFILWLALWVLPLAWLH